MSCFEYLFERGRERPLTVTLARSSFQPRPLLLGMVVLLEIEAGRSALTVNLRLFAVQQACRSGPRQAAEAPQQTLEVLGRIRRPGKPPASRRMIDGQ